MKHKMSDSLILNRQTLQIKYLKKILQIILKLSSVFIFGFVACYVGDYEIGIILFFLFIYFFVDMVKKFNEEKLELVVNTFLVQRLTIGDRLK